ncbi:hypothetical protein KRR38_34765 [Novosphingobium sp. G106]|nr:hypothetical protein [Novosphingobium sp. G106]
MDYGAKVAAYVDGFRGKMNWTSADTRFAKTTAG